MKTLSLLWAAALVFFSVQQVASQDLIVTTGQDSINCKITKIDATTIFYSFPTDEGSEMTTVIPREKVSDFERNYFTRLAGPKPGQEYRGLVAILLGGYSYRTAEIPQTYNSEVEEYMKGLKSGYNLGAELIYYFSNKGGVGFKYNTYRSSGSLDNVQIPDGFGGSITGTMADDITITFVGPVYSARLISADARHQFVTNVGVGYMLYHDEATYVLNFDLDGNTLGLAYDIGYNFGITDKLSLGVRLSYLLGTLTEVEYSDGMQEETIELDEDSYEGLGRFDASFCLSYRF